MIFGVDNMVAETSTQYIPSNKIAFIHEDAKLAGKLAKQLADLNVELINYTSNEDFFTSLNTTIPLVVVSKLKAKNINSIKIMLAIQLLQDPIKPITIVIGPFDKTYRKLALGAGAVDYIGEPAGVIKIQATIHSWVKKLTETSSQDNTPKQAKVQNNVNAPSGFDYYYKFNKDSDKVDTNSNQGKFDSQKLKDKVGTISKEDPAADKDSLKKIEVCAKIYEDAVNSFSTEKNKYTWLKPEALKPASLPKQEIVPPAAAPELETAGTKPVSLKDRLAAVKAKKPSGYQEQASSKFWASKPKSAQESSNNSESKTATPKAQQKSTYQEPSKMSNWSVSTTQNPTESTSQNKSGNNKTSSPEPKTSKDSSTYQDSPTSSFWAGTAQTKTSQDKLDNFEVSLLLTGVDNMVAGKTNEDILKQLLEKLNSLIDSTSCFLYLSHKDGLQPLAATDKATRISSTSILGVAYISVSKKTFIQPAKDNILPLINIPVFRHKTLIACLYCQRSINLNFSEREIQALENITTGMFGIINGYCTELSKND